MFPLALNLQTQAWVTLYIVFKEPMLKMNYIIWQE